MPSWHHVEHLEEMKISGCEVNAKQLDELMLAVPTSMKRLDLSKNPGILSGLDMLSWHHLERLEDIKLLQCGVTSDQLVSFPWCLPASVATVTLDPGALADGAALNAFRDAGFSEDAASPGCWRRPVVQKQEPVAQRPGMCAMC
mmetsp:Transcript_47575/g.95951  ORF Transcript_47575/g.95951 Transcript_47575/m.95951 type:complete len:144 (-) Transcript_47575:65-496(-)